MKNRFWSIILVVCCVFVFTATDYSNKNRVSHIGSIFQSALNNAFSGYAQYDLNECEKANNAGFKVWDCSFGVIPSGFDPTAGFGLHSIMWPDGTHISSHSWRGLKVNFGTREAEARVILYNKFGYGSFK